VDTVTLNIGEQVPDFTLPDLNGNERSLSAYRGRLVVLNFWSSECPWSQRADEGILQMMAEWGEEVAVLPLASNANEELETLRVAARQRGMEQLLVDGDQTVARIYGAEYTPQIYVLDAEGILRYQGAYDDVTFRQKEPTRNYLQEAVGAVLKGEQPDFSR
jgi:peroxiredoxin